MKKNFIIAIDGFSGSGKSTLAKDLAKKMGFIFIDTGAMYRGVALYALQHDCIHDKHVNENKISQLIPNIQIEFRQVGKNQHLFLNGKDVESQIRKPEIASIVSQVARIIPVRRKMVALQQQMGEKGGVVMDGRDIGSVVFPNADIKFFVRADNKIRAQRRYSEMKSKGIDISQDEILSNLVERDEIDVNRSEGPLIQTEDAILIDTSNHTRESQLKFALDIIRKKLG